MELDAILREGVYRGASDIHLVNKMRPIYRINRELTEMQNAEQLNENDLNEFFQVLTKSNEGILQSFNRERKLDMNYEVDGVRFRVNASLSNGILTYTLRIVKNELPEFRNLGLPDIVRKTALLPQGMMMITGKSNSGKTTTLNALVNEINKTAKKKILMLEDPIEYSHKSINSLIIQKEIGEGKDCLTFSAGTYNSLREDCDIVIIGEVRDSKTMDAMLEMAEAGHFVIGTMHTKSCAETIDRIINFYEISDQKTIKYMVSSVLKAVVSQRLLKGINGGLVMVPEIMLVNDIIAGAIRKEKLTSSEIEDAILTSQSTGSLSFIFSLANLVATNKISLDTAKSQIDEKSYTHLTNTIARMKNNTLNWSGMN
ncbi:MAG: Flp pilus assembly complex ATPase component TadA [Clostridia bacterium]|nr:Flp pilus assembly complex ATPase component TadA [Clostridia bacterium]